jgi:hypothetical protein
MHKSGANSLSTGLVLLCAVLFDHLASIGKVNARLAFLIALALHTHATRSPTQHPMRGWDGSHTQPMPKQMRQFLSTNAYYP